MISQIFIPTTDRRDFLATVAMEVPVLAVSIIVVRPVHKVVCAALGYIYTHCKTIDPSLDSTMQNACRLLIASFHFIAAMWLMPV